jgi:hypothetical protein
MNRLATSGRFPRSATFAVIEGRSVARPRTAELARTELVRAVEPARPVKLERAAEPARTVKLERPERLVSVVTRTVGPFLAVDAALNRDMGPFGGDEGRFDTAGGLF